MIKRFINVEISANLNGLENRFPHDLSHSSCI